MSGRKNEDNRDAKQSETSNGGKADEPETPSFASTPDEIRPDHQFHIRITSVCPTHW